ncbi:MAG: SRPBCC family protein [Desulforhopalus sp.]
MKVYILKREQTVDADLEKCWRFLRDPANLNKITPEDLHFKIISPLPEVMFDGLIIEYRISIPFFGRQHWFAEIKHIRDRISFVDEQRAGPYRLWHHYHELRQTAGGVKLLDIVHYALPYGLAGRMLHYVVIRKILNRIFDYRREKLRVILGNRH